MKGTKNKSCEGSVKDRGIAKVTKNFDTIYFTGTRCIKHHLIKTENQCRTRVSLARL